MKAAESWRTTAGLYVTQFFSLVNDNALKQLALLWALDRSNGTGTAEASPADLQGLMIVIFALPFLLFSGPAGRLADRMDRRKIIIAAKYAEIIIMLLVGIAFSYVETIRLEWILTLLFVMAAQTAYLTPAKYGIVLDLVGKQHASSVNGIMQMLGFLAIVFGAIIAGTLAGVSQSHPGAIALCLTAFAVSGTLASHFISKECGNNGKTRESIEANQKSVYQIARTISINGLLRDAMLMYGYLWLIAGLYHPIINSFCRSERNLSPFTTSVVLAFSVLGIAAGSFLAGRMGRNASVVNHFRKVTFSLVACQMLLACTVFLGVQPSPEAIAASLFVLGMLTGYLVLPVHVLIQVKGATQMRGQLLAAQGFINWTAILFSGILYQAIRWSTQTLGGGSGAHLALLALLTLLGAMLLKPTDSRLLR